MARYTSEERLKMRRALKVGKTLAREMDKRQLSDTNDSETEDVDFTKVIHPLGYYVNDRKQMIEEMFSIIKGEKLKRMLPPLLKSHTLEELKADCLVHLLGMSKKRINAILEGRDICSSSDTESESEDDREKSNLEEIQITNTGDDDLLDISVSKKEMDSLIDKSTSESKKSKSKHKEQKLVPLWSIVISDDEVDNPKIKKESDKSNKSSKTTVHRTKSKNRPGKRQKTREERINTVENGLDKLVQVENDTANKTNKGKTLLEILELEMRARAIRALLKSTSDTQESVPLSILNLQSSDVDQKKTDDPVAQKIVEAIDETLKEGDSDGDDYEPEDVELIEIPTANLCVTIDDDDDEEATKNKEKEETETEAIETEIKEEMAPVLVAQRDEEKDANESDPEIIIDITSLEDLTDEMDTPSESSTVGKADTKNTNNDPTWSERWAKSKNVEKVIKNSKICANIRKRMRFARMKKQKQLEQEKETMSADFSTIDENSVAAYNLIKEIDKSKNDACQSRNEIEPSKNDACQSKDEIEQSKDVGESQDTNYQETSTDPTDETLEPGEIRDIPIPEEMTDITMNKVNQTDGSV